VPPPRNSGPAFFWPSCVVGMSAAPFSYAGICARDWKSSSPPATPDAGMDRRGASKPSNPGPRNTQDGAAPDSPVRCCPCHQGGRPSWLLSPNQTRVPRGSSLQPG
jgi:hypothetical protein